MSKNELDALSQSERKRYLAEILKPVIDDTFKLIDFVRDDPKVNVSLGAFSEDIRELFEANIFSEDTYFFLREGYWFTIGSSEENKIETGQIENFIEGNKKAHKEVEKALKKYE